MSSRLKMTARNAFWSYFSMFVSFGLQFISRTVFIYCLGEEYLGINGLFSNVLGVLSFAELGIGTAINFCLYKPVAENNIEKIKSYMWYYKWAYRTIAVIITIIGLALIPFLNVLVKDPGNVGNIVIYYLIYLFNTVTTYFVSYKYSLVNAEQKNYIYTNVNLIISTSTIIIQVIALVIWKNFLIYLLVAAIFGVFQKIFICIYFNRLYPYLKEKNIEKLTKHEKSILITKIKALVIHKIGDVSVHQTDNIIVSAFVSTKMVGLLSNYNLFISTVSSCINVLFNSVTGSLGNLVATESKEYQYIIFKRYRFIGFWFFGFTSIALGILMTPFITLWIGKKMVVAPVVVNLLVLDYYMIVQAIVNLIASIGLVKVIGLPGVYWGTLIQGTLSSVLKPILSYKILFNRSSKYYFIDSFKYLSAVVAVYGICYSLQKIVMSQITIMSFGIMIIIVVIVPNIIFVMLFFRREEFKYLLSLIKKSLKKKK